MTRARRPPRDAKTAPSSRGSGSEAVIESWRPAGRSLVAEHWSEFQDLTHGIPSLVRRGRHAETAATIQLAANYAVLCHPGIFASQELESALGALGAAALPCKGRQRPARPPERLRVLHVATEVAAVGGHARNMWRWIGQDLGNEHSVALTRQHLRVPDFLKGAAVRSGGKVHRLNRTIGGVLTWSQRLQELMIANDVVVLHTHCEDTIPFLALGGMDHRPPVLLVNHTDHLFWLGRDFSDLVVCTRRSGGRLCAERRGIAPERIHLTPLCLEPVTRSMSRSDAKLALGLPPDAIVILSVARGMKFRPIGGEAFPDAIVPTLREDPRLHLVAVGAGDEDWSAAQASVPNRIHKVSETPEISTYRQAADIHLDTFPFVSITSLFESGLHGVPLVTRDPLAGVPTLAADSPGLDGNLMRTDSIEDLQSTILALARDEDCRRRIGDRTRQEILATNLGEGWRTALTRLYGRAFEVGPVRAKSRPADVPRFDDVDILTPFVYGDLTRRGTRDARMAIATAFALKASPLRFKLRHVAAMGRRGSLGHMPMPAWRQFVPEWFGTWIRIALPRRT